MILVPNIANIMNYQDEKELMLAFRRELILVFDSWAFGDAFGTDAENQFRAISMPNQDSLMTLTVISPQNQRM